MKPSIVMKCHAASISKSSRFPAIWGVCLAGGLSSRMGKDKALLPHHKGGTFLDYAFKLLQSLLEPVYVSCAKNRLYQGYPVICDSRESCGPIGGIYSALKKAHAANACAVMCLACDLPCMTAPILERLLKLHLQSGSMATLYLNPKSGNKEMTAAVYSCAALPWIEKSLQSNNRKLAAMLPENLLQLAQPEAGEELAFQNCNTPADFSQIFS